MQYGECVMIVKEKTWWDEHFELTWVVIALTWGIIMFFAVAYLPG